MLFNSIHSGGNTPLKTLYSRFASRWHNGVLRLGYLAAYDQLVAFDTAIRTSQIGPVLDVGTGTGAFTLSFLHGHPQINHVSLLDMSPEMLEQAETNLQAKGVTTESHVGMLGAEGISQNAYETILCAHVIEHTQCPQENLQWIFSCLALEGVLLLSVSKPHWCTAIVRWRWGHKAYPPNHIIKMLKSAGFEEISEIRFKSGPPSRTSCGYRAVRTNKIA